MKAKKAFPLRIDPELWSALERPAQAELRSVNAEIAFLLRDALRTRGIGPRHSRVTRVSPRRGSA